MSPSDRLLLSHLCSINQVSVVVGAVGGRTGGSARVLAFPLLGLDDGRRRHGQVGVGVGARASSTVNPLLAPPVFSWWVGAGGGGARPSPGGRQGGGAHSRVCEHTRRVVKIEWARRLLHQLALSLSLCSRACGRSRTRPLPLPGRPLPLLLGHCLLILPPAPVPGRPRPPLRQAATLPPLLPHAGGGPRSRRLLYHLLSSSSRKTTPSPPSGTVS